MPRRRGPPRRLDSSLATCWLIVEPPSTAPRSTMSRRRARAIATGPTAAPPSAGARPRHRARRAAPAPCRPAPPALQRAGPRALPGSLAPEPPSLSLPDFDHGRRGPAEDLRLVHLLAVRRRRA